MRNILRVVCAVVPFYLGNAQAADVLPPPMGLAEDDPVLRAKPNAGSDVVSSFHLGPLAILLEETTLSDVKELIGVGRIDRMGETGPAWLCYTIDAGPQPQRVWVSSSPLNGSFAVYEIAAITVSKADAGAQGPCPKLAVDPARLSLDDGIWLGRTTGEVQRKIGAQAKYSGFYLVFEHARPVGNGHVVDTRLVLEFREGRVVGLWARKSTRN